MLSFFDEDIFLNLNFILLNKMLIYDHAERITPKEAMLHPYFAELREKFAKEGNPSLLSDNK
jgi:serine/threonine protein kinase